MKIVFAMMDGTTVIGEGASTEEAFIAAGYTSSDQALIVSFQEKKENVLPIERSQEHPLYKYPLPEGEVRPTLQKIAFFANRQNALVHFSPKKEKWLHQFALPAHRELSQVDYYEHQLTQYTIPNQTVLLEQFKERYARMSARHSLHTQFTHIIDELEEVIHFHESVLKGIAAMRVEIEALNQLTMGALLSQPVTVVTPLVDGHHIPVQEYMYKFFNSNWLSRHMSIYQNEGRNAYDPLHMYRIIFTEVYKWVAHCRTYYYNRYSELRGMAKRIFMETTQMPLAMIMSPDSYQYVISEKGYAEDKLEKSIVWNELPIPRAAHLSAAYFKWLRNYVVDRSNVEYHPDGQISIRKGVLRRITDTESTKTSTAVKPEGHPAPKTEDVKPDTQDETPTTEDIEDIIKTVSETNNVVQFFELLEKWNRIQFLELLDVLKLQPNEYVICGSAAAVMYKAKDSNADIDICIPQDVLDRLLQQGLIKEGEKDGIHDANYQSLDHRVDIVPPGQSCILQDWTWTDWLNNSTVLTGYNFLTKEALREFYANLVAHTKQDKYIAVLANLTEENTMRYISIPFNELLTPRNDVPDDICQFVKDTAIDMFNEHGGDTLYAEFNGTCSVKVHIGCSDGTMVKNIASCTKMTSFIPTLTDTTVICTRG